MSVKYFGSDALNKLIDLVKTALGLKADDSNVVHKTGNETVGGTKTFNNSMTVIATNSGSTSLNLRGSTNASWIYFQNSGGNSLGYIGVSNDNNDKKPYFYDNSYKRLALLEETVEKIENNSNCLKYVYGGGSYGYCLLATFAIADTYVDFPITIKIYGRGYDYTTLQIKFKNVNNTDPDLEYFTYDNNNQFKLYKSGTSTWQLYGIYSSGNWGSYCIDSIVGGCVNNGINVTVNGTNVSSIPSGAVAPSNNGSQIHTLTTNWLTLEDYTWTRSAGGAYYVSGGIDIGLSSGNTIISITMTDWSTISANYVIQPYRSGGGSKIGLMSNTDSFNDNSALKFIVSYV